MADHIAIIGNEPYDEWIERDGNAQRLYEAYRDKWPDGDAQCVAIGREFHVRFNNGDGMRRVYNVDDFDNEDEWCAQCGTPIDPDGGEYYCCDVYDCDAVLCEYCGGGMTCNHYCPRHRGAEAFSDTQEPSYTYPYAFGNGNQFTFGVEIELESKLSDDFVENVTGSDIIAGWDKDASPERNGVELQSNILNMSKLPDLQRIIEGIPEYGDNAGGHIHVARTPNQCASRWFWALHWLDAAQCQLLTTTIGARSLTGNIRASTRPSTTSTRIPSSCARSTVGTRVPRASLFRLSSGYAPCTADNVTDTPRRTLDERLAMARRVKAAQKDAEERERRERAAKIRRNVEKNVAASRAARCSHGETLFATLEYRRHERRRERGRELVEERLSAPELCYAPPSRNLRPLHCYVRMAAVMVMAGDRAPVFDYFHLYHAYSGANIWNGYEYMYRHGDMAMRVVENVVRSRIARASHGKPTVESLNRTALRLYKRAGRPELNERYARIRKNIAAMCGND